MGGPPRGEFLETEPACSFRIARHLTDDLAVHDRERRFAVGLEPLLGELPQAAEIVLDVGPGSDDPTRLLGPLERRQRIDADRRRFLGLGRRHRSERGQRAAGILGIEELARPGRTLAGRSSGGSARQPFGRGAGLLVLAP